jgi:hypothetical protein
MPSVVAATIIAAMPRVLGSALCTRLRFPLTGTGGMLYEWQASSSAAPVPGRCPTLTPS